MSARELRTLARALAVLNDATDRLLAGDTGAASLADEMRRMVRDLVRKK